MAYRGMVRSPGAESFGKRKIRRYPDPVFCQPLALFYSDCSCRRMLGVFGIQAASFAAIIAAGGLAIGLVFRPFKVDDLVQVGGVLGTIEEVDLFTCNIKSLDNRLFIIPNSKIFGRTIENLTHYPKRRVDISIGVTCDADIEQTRRVLEGVIEKIPGALTEPAAQIFWPSWWLRQWTGSCAFGAILRPIGTCIRRRFSKPSEPSKLRGSLFPFRKWICMLMPRFWLQFKDVALPEKDEIDQRDQPAACL